jgi:hypothetical protein
VTPREMDLILAQAIMSRLLGRGVEISERLVKPDRQGSQVLRGVRLDLAIDYFGRQEFIRNGYIASDGRLDTQVRYSFG